MKQSDWVFWQEIAEKMQCSRTKAFAIIRQLNDELEKRGFLTYRGRVSRRYFQERYYC